MTDIAVIGAGPAGLSAAVNALQRNRSVIVFGRDKSTSYLYKAEKVNNYLGLNGLKGSELMEAFLSHACRLNIEIKQGRVLQIVPMGDYFSINHENEVYEAKTIVLATGITKGGQVKGEEEFLGRGVSYCATCDGMFYKGKTVAVVGEIDEADEDVNFLSKICEKIHYFPKEEKGIEFPPNVVVQASKVTEVKGEQKVSEINTTDGSVQCQGIFFVKGAMPASSLVPGLKTEGAVIEADRLMQTNVPGVFAAGDCTGWPFQLAKAVGEGLIAAQQADRYLSQKEKGNKA